MYYRCTKCSKLRKTLIDRRRTQRCVCGREMRQIKADDFKRILEEANANQTEV